MHSSKEGLRRTFIGGIEEDIHEGLRGLACIPGTIGKEIHEGLHGQACIPRRIPKGFAWANSRVVLGMFFSYFVWGGLFFSFGPILK